MKGHAIKQQRSHNVMVQSNKFAVVLRAGLALLIMTAGASAAALATFDDLPLPPESFYNGDDLMGGFTSGAAAFNNNYNAEWASWDGFAYANLTDRLAEDFAAQYNAIPGTGQGHSPNYAVAYIGWTEPPTVTLNVPQTLEGLYVTNNNYAYYSLLRGSLYSKQFGGPTGNDQDWFLLTITGKDAASQIPLVEKYQHTPPVLQPDRVGRPAQKE